MAALLTAAAFAFGGLGSIAFADHSLTEVVLTDGGWTVEDTSEDGRHVFFRTDQSLVPEDTDGNLCPSPPGCRDIYERFGGTTTLLSIGPSGGNGAFDAFFAGSSADGSGVLFTTRESLVPEDNDSCFVSGVGFQPCNDVYLRSGGGTTLVSTGPSPGSNSAEAFAVGISSDATRIIFQTTGSLVPEDTDTRSDIYERSGSTTTLISNGPGGGNGNFDATFKGMVPNGSRVFFETRDALVSEDTDTTFDVYERFGATTTLVSSGPVSGPLARDAFFLAASRDGNHVFFQTAEGLLPEDSDGGTDAYERFGGTTTLITTAAGGSNFSWNFGGISEDGTHAYFETQAPLVAEDDDSNGQDVYVRSGGVTSLVSTSPLVTNGPYVAEFVGASQDGAHAWFTTNEKLVGQDDDGGYLDIYERAGGNTTLVSTGPSDTNEFVGDNYFMHASIDGTRVFFSSRAKLVSADTDSELDLYERYAGTTTLIGGRTYVDASRDGTRVFHITDALRLARVGYPHPNGAAKVRVTLVAAFDRCTSPNTGHGAPLSIDSCAPPTQSSSHLTVPSDDSSQANGSVVFKLRCTNAETPPCPAPGEQEDVNLTVNANDVRKRSDMSEYTGELEARVALRITDKYNGPTSSEPATVTDATLSFAAACASTPAPELGGGCSVTTSMNAVSAGLVKENQRAVWELGQIVVHDGGSDGVASTTAGNAPFLRQAIFVP